MKAGENRRNRKKKGKKKLDQQTYKNGRLFNNTLCIKEREQTHHTLSDSLQIFLCI